MAMPAKSSFDRRDALRRAALGLAAVQVGLPGAVHAGGGEDQAQAQSPRPARERNIMATPNLDTASDVAIRPFRVQVPDEALADLRQRLAMTRWPDQETVADRSQGVQSAAMQDLVRYWGTDYDWRKAEARLNAFPQFLTTIDGLDVHFLHVRSPHPNALPLIMTHGWPGSVFELLKAVGPLTDPPAHGGRAADAFDLVLPSLPGFGFSGKPTGVGWGPDHIAGAWAALMQ